MIDIFEAVYFSQDFTQQKFEDHVALARNTSDSSVYSETGAAEPGVTKLSKAEVYLCYFLWTILMK